MASVNGPYKHGTRWRIVVVREGGARSTRSYPTEEEALAVIRAARREISGGILVSDAVDRFETWLKSTGVKPITLQTERQRLNRALAKHLGITVDSLGSRAPAIYEALRSGYAVQTHRLTLATLKRFGRWLVDEGFVRRPPFDKVKPIGRPNRGKPQLRVDESRRLVDACIRELATGRIDAVQPAIAILMGLRASEVAGLECRDVDDAGRLLWVAQTQHKTEASRRMMEVPTILQATLDALAKDELGKTKRGKLIPGATRFTVYHHVKRLCRVAKVPEVTPHGLRGTHATLATSAGATAELVMAALGHTSVTMAQRHYTDQAVAGAVKGRKVAGLLGKKKETQ